MRPRALVLGPLLATLLLAVPASAVAGGRDDVRRTGSCSAASDWRLRAKEVDGRIELRGRVLNTRSGRAWTWRIKHNGSVSASGRAVTRSGHFEVRRTLVDLAGADLCVFRAVSVRTGEVCRGRVYW